MLFLDLAFSECIRFKVFVPIFLTFLEYLIFLMIRYFSLVKHQFPSMVSDPFQTDGALVALLIAFWAALQLGELAVLLSCITAGL